MRISGPEQAVEDGILIFPAWNPVSRIGNQAFNQAVLMLSRPGTSWCGSKQVLSGHPQLTAVTRECKSLHSSRRVSPICTSSKSARPTLFTQPRISLVPAGGWMSVLNISVKIKKNIEMGQKKNFLRCLLGGPTRFWSWHTFQTPFSRQFLLASSEGTRSHMKHTFIPRQNSGSHNFPQGSWGSNNLVFSVQLLAHVNPVTSWCLKTPLQNKSEMQITYLNYNTITFLFIAIINLLLYYNHILSHIK